MRIQDENPSSVFAACRKRRLNGAVLGITLYKGWYRVGAGTGTLKKRVIRNVYGVGSPTVGTISSSVGLHICAVTYITEISLHVT